MKFTDLVREARFLFAKKGIVGLLLIAFLLAVFSVWTGIQEVAQQNDTITRLIKADTEDRQAVLAQQHDYGSAAYYSFHLTYSPPSALAFAALGERDIYPWKHRIRMLALEGQIHESDLGNPELAQIGRIDFTFVIGVLAPLFIILLLHDLRAAERSAGRYDLLTVTAKSANSLWLSRTIIVLAALSLVLLVPFWIGALLSDTPAGDVFYVSLIGIAHLCFWAALSYWVGKSDSSAPRLASALLGIWLVTTFIIPAAGNGIIEKMTSSPQGGDILLTQREAVNDAWDIPAQTTMDAFTATYPEWKNHTHMNSLFEWKWYYAFQQVGDQKAAALSAAYRQAAQEKYQTAGLVSWLSPATLVQRLMTHLAKTDAPAAYEYEQQVRDFHSALRTFYYPLLFKEPRFEPKLLDNLPAFSVDNKTLNNKTENTKP